MTIKLFYLKFIIFTAGVIHASTKTSYLPENFPPADNPFAYISQKNKPGEVDFVVTIPHGSTLKNELRIPTGSVILDRVLCPRQALFMATRSRGKVHAYPVNYGIIPGRYDANSNFLEIMVLGKSELFKKMLDTNSIKAVQVRVIGLIKMERCKLVPCRRNSQWTPDWKILAVHPEDFVYGKMKEITDLSDMKKRILLEFLSNYMGDINGAAQTRVRGLIKKGFTGSREAFSFIRRHRPINRDNRSKEIRDCNNLYSNLLKSMEKIKKEIEPAKNEKFLNCLSRVFYKDFFRDEQTLRFFLKFSAYQLLVQNLNISATYENSLKQMNMLRKKKRRHYRFVGLDTLNKSYENKAYVSRGSGNPIYEWVETRNWNLGCGLRFRAQHYEDNPLVDIPGFKIEY